MNILFEEHSVLCKIVRTTAGYWNYIVEVKHPESFNPIGFEKSIEFTKETLREPDVVIREQMDPGVCLYYKYYGKYSLCVVAKHLNGDGYIITAYMTDHIKKGEIIYEKDKGLLR